MLDKIRSVVKRLLHPILYKRALRRSKVKHSIHFDGFTLDIFPEVFNPLDYGSTKVFYNFLRKQSIDNKKVLELGAGSGLLSFLMCRNGAKVVASDINRSATAGLKVNMEKLDLHIEIAYSDIFSSLPSLSFDKIIVNPPYYRGVPSSAWEHAFYAGKDLEYFDRLFSQAADHLRPDGEIYMILSRDMDTTPILAKATRNSFSSKIVESRRVYWEWFDIFSLKPYYKPGRLQKP